MPNVSISVRYLGLALIELRGEVHGGAAGMISTLLAGKRGK